MAAVTANIVLSGGLSLRGIPSLPATRIRASSSKLPSRSGSWSKNSVLKRISLEVSSQVRSIANASDRDEPSPSSEVFQSMLDGVERRESDAALRSFTAEDVARAISDAERLAQSDSKNKAVQPPRFATLRAFGEAGGEGVVTGEFEGTSVFELLAANIEASKQVKNWEVLSGRLAMLAFSVAVGVELFTGNSVFKGIDTPELEAAGALCALATLSAGGFAYAWRAKTDVVSLMSKGYKNMLESALDTLIDGLFFDEV